MSSNDFIVTPWHVEGDIDYDKLIKKFVLVYMYLKLSKTLQLQHSHQNHFIQISFDLTLKE